MLIKTCSNCGRTLEANKENFPSHFQYPDGLDSRCRQCTRKAMRKWNLKNSSKHVAMNLRCRRKKPELYKRLQMQLNSRHRGLGYLVHYRNIIREEYCYHHITDKSVVAMPADLHTLYKGLAPERHRVMCQNVIRQIYRRDLLKSDLN